MKKSLILLLLLVVIGFFNVQAYDFSATAPSGQTLYYNIVGFTA